MIDLHCHILPGIDDGPKNWDESLAMARMAVDEGITHILATPHHMNRSWMNPKKNVVTLTNELQDLLDKEYIPLIIFPGQEVRIHGEILKNIQKDEICFIDEFNKYLLIEFPTPVIPEYTDRLFFELQNEGITPVIVHPERNHAILKDPSILKSFVDRGILAQLTAASYIGGFGRNVEKLSHELISSCVVHFIASDAHNISNRPFYMRKAYQKLEKEFGQEKVEEFQQVTKDLVNGDPVNILTPMDIKPKKRFFGLL